MSRLPILAVLTSNRKFRDNVKVQRQNELWNIVWNNLNRKNHTRLLCCLYFCFLLWFFYLQFQVWKFSNIPLVKVLLRFWIFDKDVLLCIWTLCTEYQYLSPDQNLLLCNQWYSLPKSFFVAEVFPKVRFDIALWLTMFIYL